MREIPLFPLLTVLFPGMPLQLHIFEQRYLEMVRACLLHNQPFGVLLIRQGAEAHGPLAVPYSVGCTANIVEIDGQADGSLNLLAIGDERFAVHEVKRSLPYLTGKVTRLQNQFTYGPQLARGVKTLARWVDRYLSLINRLSPNPAVDLSLSDLPEDPMLLLYLAASILQVPNLEKQALLEMSNSEELRQQLERLYRREVAVLGSTRSVPQVMAERLAWLN